MSTTSEEIAAQEGAWMHIPPQWWHRHLMSPSMFEHLLKQSERFNEHLRSGPYRAIASQVVSGSGCHVATAANATDAMLIVRALNKYRGKAK